VYGNALINKMAAMDLGIPEEDVVIFEENFRNTQDEALTLREYIGNNREIESIILVISKYYSKSAKKIFEKALNVLYREVDIYSSPSRYDVFNTEQWWKDREDIKWVILEHLKLANFCFREQILL
jgi:uncharacterized SAM-binding protein YcdF (DUF218 family)